jgi:cyclopropane-fatty-acyl-phospholipid synthase
MNHFAAPTRCDRILSVEMFEHMRNWELLLRRAKSWLLPEGRIFLHVFAHKEHAYPYEVKDDSDWMSAYFFTGGMMPSNDLLEHLDTGLAIEQHWVVSGTHYAHTAERWLQNLDSKRSEVLPILRATYGKDDEFRWYQRWRLFFLACAELFAYRGGKEWWVAHTLLRAEDSR